MTESYSLQKNRTKRLHDDVISIKNTYIHTYINPQTQSKDRAITQSYMVNQPCIGRDCKQNKYALFKLSMGYKQNDVVIENPK